MDLLVVSVGEFGVGNRDFAFEPAKALFLILIVNVCDLRLELLVSFDIDPADEKTRNAGDLFGVAAARDEFFEASYVSFKYLRIDLLRKQQRDIDTDALRGKCLDCWKALTRTRYFHHEVFASDAARKPQSFGESTFGISCEIWRDFKAHVPVIASRVIVNRPQHICRILNVFDGNGFIEIDRRLIVFPQKFRNCAVIFIAATNSLLKNRRI